MENIIISFVSIMPFGTIGIFLAFLFRKTKTYTWSGTNEVVGYKTELKYKGAGNFEGKSSMVRDSGGAITCVYYSGIGVFLKTVGYIGGVSLILTLIEPYVSELLCMCSIGIIDVRDNKFTTSICILIISIIIGIIILKDTLDDNNTYLSMKHDDISRKKYSGRNS